MRNPVPPLSLAILLALGGCAGGAVTTISDTSSLYSFGEFLRASDGRDTIVVVRGNPFKMDQKAFEKAVTDAMQGQHWGPRTNFTTQPTENAKKEFKVVILFNGSQTVLGDNLCEAPEKFDSGKNGVNGLHVTATYCWEDAALTVVDGWAPAGTGVGSPTFTSLVAQTTFELFPPVNEHTTNDRNDGPFEP